MRSVLALPALGLLAACVSSPPPSAPAPRPPPVADLTVCVGVSVEGRPIQCRMLGRGEEIVLILATIHGDEWAGTPMVQRLGEHLVAHPALLDDRTVILIADANPDGHAAGTRGNARGVDLNRNFPAANHATGRRGGATPLSEPESRALHGLILKVRPARVVSIHQPLALIDHDGPAEDLACAMAKACRLPVRKLGGRPGSMGSWVGIDLGIPVVTVELPAGVERLSVETLWSRYGRMLLVAIPGP